MAGAKAQGEGGGPIEALRSREGSPGRISRSDFEDDTNTPNTQNELEEIARYTIPRPRVLRGDKPVRLVVPAYETFSTNGTADDTETFSLSNDIIQSDAAEDLVLYDDGSRVDEDSIDYANNSFDYTDSGTGSDLDVWYVCSDAARVLFEKEAPAGQSTINEEVFESNTALLHRRDQQTDGITVDTSGKGEAFPVLPEDYDLVVKVDAPYTVRFEDDDAEGLTPTNMHLLIPTEHFEESPPGLGEAVKRDIAGLR
jgi:hypothetical protein